MNITITGAPGSNHYNVAKKLGDRLGLKFNSARNVVHSKYSQQESITYDDKYNTDMFNAVNDLIVPTIRNSNDYIFDGLLASKFATSAIRIFLDIDFMYESKFVSFRYGQRAREESVSADYLDGNLYNPDKYDLFINVTGMTVDAVVEFIIACMRNGKYGMYLPIYLLQPSNNLYRRIDDFGSKSWGIKSLDPVFNVSKYLCSYFISDSYDGVLNYATNSNNFVAINKEFLKKPDDILSPDVFDIDVSDWFSRFDDMANFAELDRLMSIACLKAGSNDTESFFYILSKYCSDGKCFDTNKLRNILMDWEAK